MLAAAAVSSDLGVPTAWPCNYGNKESSSVRVCEIMCVRYTLQPSAGTSGVKAEDAGTQRRD